MFHKYEKHFMHQAGKKLYPLPQVIILFCFVIAIFTILYRPVKASESVGTVIILNGPSAAGKSSIQKEFQYLMMPQLWIKLGIDNLFDKPMPDITMENLAYWQSPNPIRWVETTKDAQNNPIMTLFTGEQGEKVAHGMNSAIASYAKAGNNIIVDYIAYKKEWVEDLRNKLKDVETFWVKVEIPLEVLEAREVARGTSPKGHARSHYDTVHWDIKYDLTVNSDKDSAIEIAKQIKTAIVGKNMHINDQNIPMYFEEIWALGDPATIEKKFVELLEQTDSAKNTSKYLQLLSQIALAQALQKKFDEAHKALDSAELLLTPEYTLAKTRILLERGRAYHQADNLDKAMKYFEQSYEFSVKHHFDYYAIDAAHMIAIITPK